MLDNSDKAILLELARKALEIHFDQEPESNFKTDRPGLLERKGVFVTLHKGGELRGCIGQLTPDQSLYEVVQRCALSAAFEDFRFPPLKENELPGLEVEISVLTPFHRIRDVDEITVGKHGLYMIQGYQRGLLLPQVAVEYGWDCRTFLEQTCHKAGLSGSAWMDPQTELYIFEAEIFSDPKKPVQNSGS